MSIIPIKGKFEGWRALLAHVMEGDDIEHLVIVTTHKDGSMHSAHFEMTREQHAYAALLLQQAALS